MKGPNIFLKKSMKALASASESEDKNALKRHLNATSLTSIGIGAIIGAGVFVITGQAASFYAGPAVVLSFLAAAIICVFAALCYAELASFIPISGGAYSYAYVALGEFPAWLIGWSSMVQYLVAVSVVAIGWSSYFSSLLSDFGLHLSSAFATGPFAYGPEGSWHLSGAIFNVPAFVVVILIGALISIGIKAATALNNIMVVVKLSTIVLLIVICAFYVDPSNWVPFIPENTGVFGEFGWSGVLRGAGLLLFAYSGFDAVATLSQETINPQTNVPKGVLGSLGISTVAYIVLTLMFTGVVSYTKLGVADPVALVLDAMGPKFIWLGFVVKFAIFSALTSVILAILLAQTRIFFVMSKDGLISSKLANLHPKLRTPVLATAISSLIGAILAGLFPAAILGQLVSLAVLIIFSLVCFGVLTLRYTNPEIKRPFKVPFVPYIPLLGIACCLGQAMFLPLTVWAQFGVWLLIGLVVYFKFGFKHSTLRKAIK